MAVRVLEYAEIRAIAEEIDLQPNSALGQYFVHDPGAVSRIVSACEVNEHDHVLHIGSGMGALTLGFLAVGAHVDAVDIDSRLARRLPVTAVGHCHSEVRWLSVLNRDALDLREADAPAHPTVALVSLPQNVTTAAVLHLLAEFPSIRRIVAVVDSAAQLWTSTTRGMPGYDVSVAKLRYLTDIRQCGDVSPAAFWPAPPRAPDLVRLDRLD